MKDPAPYHLSACIRPAPPTSPTIKVRISLSTKFGGRSVGLTKPAWQWYE
ncbi:MAG: hypothetical protein V7K92_20075 [Nostoc sp.]